MKSFTFPLTFLGFCWTFKNACFPEHLEAEASVYVKRKNFENYILGKLKICRLWNFLPQLRLRANSDTSVYIWKHLLKNVEKIKHSNTIDMLPFRRQDFSDLDTFIIRFSFYAATNTDLLCIFLLSTDYSLNSIKKSFTITVTTKLICSIQLKTHL